MSTSDPAHDPVPPDPPAQEHAAEPQPSGKPFPIVGIGASAGGLEALTELLENLPPKPGMAFLFVSHLEPHHKSHLAEILAKVSPIPIQEATEGAVIEVDHAYLIPPNSNMALTNGKLALTPRPPGRGQHMPIDHLFRSLANIQRSRAIGVLLSGGGTDGTLGFQSIKAEGGVTFAQDEKSARATGMPRSAIADGSVDYVLPPGQIAQSLVHFTNHTYTKTADGPAEALPQAQDAVKEILALLRSRMEVDFTHYKRTTVQRRIQRRMALRGHEHVEDYLTVLRNDPIELRNLYQDFLIRVTQFFRDPEAFDTLKEKVFPALLAKRPPSLPVRIWVAGCSTGEEVYSLIICLLEDLGGRSDNVPIKVLATDLNEAALEKARSGLYIDNIEIDVTPERLRRFFVRVDGHYQISKTVRDLCVFSRHNLASDPPFSHLDVVSCRNVLIYMDNALQRHILPVLHYALNPGGFLFLGPSEHIGAFAELFNTVDPRHRIFAKKEIGPTAALDFTSFAGAEIGGRSPEREVAPPLWSALDVQKEADRIVLSRYAPVGVVIDESMIVLQFRGRTAPYLEPAPGMANLDLLRMLREGLLAEVRAAVSRARIVNTPVVKEKIPLRDGERMRSVQVEVIPFKVPPAGVRFFLVLFQDRIPGAEAPAAPSPAPAAVRPADNDEPVTQLQHELTALREYLQSVIEEQESTNEELKSANEEILSSNEELQSTNEELQTAKEEAQSANEELATVNEELRHRNTELARLNNDLINLLSGVNIPIVMVSRDLRIRRFTPLAEKLFNLIPTDVGRPMSDIRSNLNNPDLVQLTAAVIDTLTPFDGQVEDRDGHWYSLRIRPYVTLDSKIDGASLVLLDIDALRRDLDRAQPNQVKPAAPGTAGPNAG